MMTFFQSIWNPNRKPHLLYDGHFGGEESSIREHITRVIIRMLGGTLGLFTFLIFLGWWAGEFGLEAPIIIMATDLPFIFALALVERGKWQMASFFPPVTFFLLGAYLNYNSGLVTAGMLFYAISILLAGMLQGNKGQFLTLGTSISVYVLIGIFRTRASLDDLLPSLLMVSGSYLGIALLQWLSNSQFHQALAQAYAAANTLEERSTELTKSNEDLQQQILARIEVQNALQETERTLSTLMGNLPGMAYRCQNHKDWTMEFVSEGCLSLTGYLPEDLICSARISYNEIIHPEDSDRVFEEVQAGLQNASPFELIYRIQTAGGETKWVWEKGRGILSPQGEVLALEGFITDISDRIQKETDLKQQAQMLGSIYETALVTSSVLDKEELLHCIYQQVAALLNPDTFIIVFYEEATNEMKVAYATEEGKLLTDWMGKNIPLESGGLTGWVLRSRKPLLVDDMERELLPIPPVHGARPARSWLGVPLYTHDRLVGGLSVQSFLPGAFTQDHLRFFESLATQLAISLENAGLFEEIRERASELEALTDISQTLRTALTVEEMLPDLLKKTAAAFGACIGSIYLLEQETGDLTAQGWYPSVPRLHGHRLSAGGSVAGQIAAAGKVYVTENMDEDPWNYLLPYDCGGNSTIRTGLSLPLRTHDSIVGVMNFGLQESLFLVNEKIPLATTIADMAALAIWRAHLFEETQRRFEHLVALRKIDRTITSTMELRPILEIMLDQIAAQLHVDAATILLLSPHTQTLDTAARRGFNTPALLHTHLPLGEGFAGRAALERRIIHIRDLTKSGSDLNRADLLAHEGFVSYFAYPLIAKGQVKGVLELFLRLPFAPNQEWLDFLDALATQAAIAIDNAELFESMQSANYQLVKAYEATIEGWSKALELRDQETEGHSQRVTEMTLRLARDMGLGDEELVHIRRGALLHDIGKMAVPDHILLKPGPLTEEEWEIMRRHPTNAYELLSPIAYLRPALDIPYCHHEKWDGSGYPRRLKGEQIPLSARIFAVVDVWDALSSDRPYRKAWANPEIIEYILKESGRHFDPVVVNVFFSTLDQPGPSVRVDFDAASLPTRRSKR